EQQRFHARLATRKTCTQAAIGRAERGKKQGSDLAALSFRGIDGRISAYGRRAVYAAAAARRAQLSDGSHGRGRARDRRRSWRASGARPAQLQGRRER